MARRYYRHRKDTDSPRGFLVIAGVLGLIILYNFLSVYSATRVIALFLTLGMSVLLIIFLMQRYRADRQRQRLQALGMIDVSVMDGLAFERYVVELLKSQGYKNVLLTPRYDYGVDIIAEKDNIRWGIQVKRYSNIVKVAAVRQVVTALNTYKCQKAMVITNNYYSRPAKKLAQDNDCILIDRDTLADWIIKFQQPK